MSSSVHFKFKSQREPSRVTFDGTGISVFELKREIINQSRLGDGTDFELSIYNEDTKEEYDDDTSVIPRSTSVIARRLPASRPGKGGAARYVSGKMPVNARNAPRSDQPTLNRSAPSFQPISNGVNELNNAQTEEEKISALFNLQANQWKEQQQEMANATPVMAGRGRGKNVSVPDHPPPPGYICYRCHEKGKAIHISFFSASTSNLTDILGHWIQACPTNNDPKFDGKYRVKRSTGIPRSLQTKVEKPESLMLDGSSEDLRNTGVMVNADGDFIITKPDQASWELYQEKVKANAAAAAEAAAAERSRELQARGLECPIDKRMFLEPTKTPCCQKTYCNDCITNALIESDFVCPGCGTEGVLLDNLSANDEVASKIKVYETDKADSKKEKEKPSILQENQSDNDPSLPDSASTTKKDDLYSTTASSKKRPAEESNFSEPTALKKQKSDDSQLSTQAVPSQTKSVSNDNQQSSLNQQMPFGMPGFMSAPGGSGMAFSETGFAGDGMGFFNPMAMPLGNVFPSNMDPTWNPMNMMNFNALAAGMYNNGANGAVPNSFGIPGAFPNAGEQPLNMFAINQMPGPLAQNAGFGQSVGAGNFSNQQRTAFSTPYAREEDSPYFRQPVNPQRHQARHRRIRPSDYREL
ncbi:DWNN domain-containing protein [Aspergillus karnatakaensis]|uniref:cleavage polyadenylation factor subunit MPE1 n=1 Tax=Aspergillus karnatakaensis TaxID=1810916 RepID=UPI003CCCD380